jgi:hypothetical protein
MTALAVETAVSEAAPEAVDFFKANVASTLHELIDAVPWRHEWENLRMHLAADNLSADPATILAKQEPISPTQGQPNIQITALQTTVDSLTSKLDALAAQNAALLAALSQGVGVTPVATTPAAPTLAAAPVQAPVAPPEPVAVVPPPAG